MPPYCRFGDVIVSWKRRDAVVGVGEEMRATEVSSLCAGVSVAGGGGGGKGTRRFRC